MATVDGVLFLSRLVAALHLVLGLSLGAGVRFISQVLELAGLDPFMANSVRWHQDRAQTLERCVRSFGREERLRTSAVMKPKSITLCGDETFFPHGQICLVAIEPVSNVIVTESFVTDREAKTWNAAVKEDLTGIPVTVVQSTADEGTSLAAHARSLKSNHSPDVFHVQHEVCGGVALALSHQVRDASKAAGVAADAAEAVREQKTAYQATSHGPGRPPNWDERIADADETKIAADMAHEAAHDRREEFRASNRGVSAEYPPFDVKTGEPLTAAAVVERVEARLTESAKVATEAELGNRATAAIAKARRVVPGMKNALLLHRPNAVCCREPRPRRARRRRGEPVSCARRIPRARRKTGAKGARTRAAPRAGPAATRSAVAAAPELGTLSAEARAAVDATATECANLFQLTGVPQRDLFEYVLVRMPDLARPRVSAGAVMT